MVAVSPLQGLKTPVTVLRHTTITDTLRDSEIVSYTPTEVISVLSTLVGSNESWGTDGNILTRSFKLRYFGKLVISERDRLLINGEEYLIDGASIPSKGVGNRSKVITTIFVHKTGGSNV